MLKNITLVSPKLLALNTIRDIFSSVIDVTIHKDIFRTLQAYEMAVDKVAIVSITDLDGNIIYVNEKFTAISGYSKEELIGSSHRIINSGHHTPDFFKEMWQAISSGIAWRGEIKNRKKDGSYYWVDTVITPVRDEHDHIFQYLSIRNIITVQKEHEVKLLQFQKDLLKRKQQLKDAQQVAKTGSWYLDVPGNQLEWSEETYRIFEIPFDTRMTYQLFLEAVHPEDRAAVDASWLSALQSGDYQIEHRIITASGEKWVSENARLEFDPSSKLRMALGTVQDITEKKKTENILRESEALYKDLFNNSPFAVGIMDKASMGFLEVNETAMRLYGYSKDEFLQLTAYDVRVSAEHQQLKELIESGDYAIDNSIRAHRKKDGTVMLIEPTITEISYKGKQAFLISINDVTEKIKMQEELRAERIRHQKEVDRATLDAQEKSRAEIGRELHDNINQLLVASTLFLKKAVPASEKDKSLMQTGTGIIGNAIEEIRRLSSHFVPPSLNDLTLTESIEFLSRHFKLTETNITFDVAFNEKALEESFKINIYRIIQEQFNNIIKHAAATKVGLQLKQAEHTLTLVIQDNGKGFDKTQKTKGIGLANIIHRAHVFNGKVTINSAPGQGCELVVLFELDR